MFAYNSAVFAGERTGSIVFEPVGAPAYEINSVSADSLVEAPAVLENMVQALSSGAWSNSAAGPTIYSKNIWYLLSLNPVGTIPSTAKITSVSWTWALSTYPSGLTVGLCWKTNLTGGKCGDVTSQKSGSTSSFFAGLAANQKMVFEFIVQGSGTMSPDYGKVDQVIVNYTY